MSTAMDFDNAGVPSAFIRSLWSMLGDSANADIIAWLPDGASFCVSDTAQLQERVLPQYFAHRKMSSFTRQLTAYGFVSLRGKPRGSSVAFRHNNDLFCRDQPQLSARIVRQSQKRPARERAKRKSWSRKRLRSSATSDTSSSGESDAATSVPTTTSPFEHEERLLNMQLAAQRVRIAQLVAHIAQLTEQLTALPAVPD